jgi:hypothetical protein
MNGELRALLVCVLAHVHQLSGETNVGQFFSILKNDHLYISELQEQAISMLRVWDHFMVRLN